MDNNQAANPQGKETAQNQTAQNQTAQNQTAQNLKFCKQCGGKIAEAAVICPLCGCQVEEIKTQQAQQPQIVINNANNNVNTNVVGGVGGKMKNKWTAVLLCFFLGGLGAHKFYEGKVGMGILYILTAGLFGIGWVIDFFVLLFKPNPYYV